MFNRSRVGEFDALHQRFLVKLCDVNFLSFVVGVVLLYLLSLPNTWFLDGIRIGFGSNLPLGIR